MKKLLLIASLAIVAVVVVPVAAANAATLTGSCVLSGNASFTKTLSETEQTGIPYTFTGGGECAGTSSTGATVTGKASAKVEGGTFRGTCATATSETEGSGTLTVANGETFAFKLAFHAAAGNVVLEVSGEGGTKATGDAEFLTSPTQAAECRGAGVKQLSFEALTAGQI